MRKFRQKYYDWFSHVYDRFIAMHASGQQGMLKTVLAEKAELEKGGRILDICTGTGALLNYLHRRLENGGMVVGVDFSGGMLGVARGKTAGANRLFLVQADVSRLPFKEDAFDTVTCAHAFYELKGGDQESCLREIGRILKPGKPFLMMEHDVPRKPLIRMLFYIRLMSMGAKKAFEILRHEKEILGQYFSSVEKITVSGGRSKILVCRR
ncbi:hypothetical protein DENIS_1715 [Desulfonema ishimotonii]|uniref:Methyltransferase domain-containing protein n=1 Tax=Desulfonema ishimotonii TaxID=45657 RepID=A0A401FUW0_9BACT|nr:class I SAM-dependent methyltransferase [Desulfonema ishimotonii]GBC60756.1 hypothetical protein DENIS_1715 [Desulfonema ishimotonii]